MSHQSSVNSTTTVQDSNLSLLEPDAPARPQAVSPETLPSVTWQQARVITTDLLAKLYGTGESNIHDNYRKNSERFVEGTHFFKLEGEALREFKKSVTGNIPVSRVRNLTLWTERGAARHAKMLDTDAAWEVFEKLEDCYFRAQEAAHRAYATNSRDILTASQAEQLRQMIRAKAETLPTKETKAAFTIKAWSKLKSHFGVTYRNIPQCEFTEALSLVSRHVAEWELLEAPTTTQPATDNTMIYDPTYRTEVKREFDKFADHITPESWPTTPEARQRIADGFLADMLGSRRWLLSFDHRGNFQLTGIPQDAAVIEEKEIADMIREPGAVSKQSLMNIMTACVERLNKAQG